MKATKISLILIIIFGILYFYVDSQLYYYGESDLDIHTKLAMKIKPENRPDFEGGFALKDKYGITIAAKGNTYKYESQEIIIHKVLNYCYNEEKITVQFIDEKKSKYFIQFSKNLDKSQNEINYSILNVDGNLISSDSDCIDFENNQSYMRNMILIRNFILVFLMVLISFFIYKLIRLVFKRF